jgi:hypothetical protein
MCCITAASDAHYSLLVSFGPAVREVFDQEVREGIDIQIETAAYPDANAEIFDRYYDTVLFPAVGSNRQIE